MTRVGGMGPWGGSIGGIGGIGASGRGGVGGVGTVRDAAFGAGCWRSRRRAHVSRIVLAVGRRDLYPEIGGVSLVEFAAALPRCSIVDPPTSFCSFVPGEVPPYCLIEGQRRNLGAQPINARLIVAAASELLSQEEMS